jgi:hypothetical protein
MAVTRAEAASAIARSPQEGDEGKDAALDSGSNTAVELDGRQRFFTLRGHWSWAIIAWISILIVFNCGLAVGAGLGFFDFKDYQWLITAVTVETFLQVVGLGYVAAKYLFSKG